MKMNTSVTPNFQKPNLFPGDINVGSVGHINIDNYVNSNNNYNNNNEINYTVNDKNAYIDVILEIKNVQLDIMKLLQTMQNDICNVKHDIKSSIVNTAQLKDNTCVPTKIMENIIEENYESGENKIINQVEKRSDSNEINRINHANSIITTTTITSNGNEDDKNDKKDIDSEENVNNQKNVNLNDSDTSNNNCISIANTEILHKSDEKVMISNRSSSSLSCDFDEKSNTYGNDLLQDSVKSITMKQTGDGDDQNEEIINTDVNDDGFNDSNLKNGSCASTTRNNHTSKASIKKDSSIRRNSKRSNDGNLSFPKLPFFTNTATKEDEDSDNNEDLSDECTSNNKKRNLFSSLLKLKQQSSAKDMEEFNNSVRSLFQITITCDRQNKTKSSFDIGASTRSMLSTTFNSHNKNLLFSKEGNSFQKFAILSIEDDYNDDIVSLNSKVKYWGSTTNTLTPILLNSNSCSLQDFYPSTTVSSNTLIMNNINQSDSLDESVISDISIYDEFVIKQQYAFELFPFCFPYGLEVRFLPSGGKDMVENLGRLGWIGKQADRYQIHAFHDMNGKLRHGISMTIKELVIINKKNNYYSILKSIKNVRIKRIAAYTILNYWRIYRENYINNKANKKETILQKVARRRRNSFVPNVALFSNNNNEFRRKSFTLSMGSSKTSTRNYNNSYSSLDSLQDEEEIICIVEKCYIMIGTKPENHSLLFIALQKMVDLERETGKGKMSIKRNTMIYNTRQLLLEEIQYKLCLTPDQSNINYPSSELDHINQKNKIHEIILDEPIPKISFLLPLPQLSNEYGVARLILQLKLPVLINILMLLLLEKSILVVSDSYEDVSSCIFALIDLLKPYKWGYIMIPILSDDRMNILYSSLESNVPFIVGMVNKYCINDILKKEQDRDLTIVNMVNGDILWTDDVDIRKNQFTHGQNIMYHPYNELNEYQKRLEYLASSATTTLHSFKSFFHYGPSIHESLTLKSIKSSIQKHILKFSGLLCLHSNGWKVYRQKVIKEDTSRSSTSSPLLITESTDFDKNRYNSNFSPSEFYKTYTKISNFQKIFCKSQLLSTYYDEKRRFDTRKNYFAMVFIADWIYFNWYIRKRKGS